MRLHTVTALALLVATSFAAPALAANAMTSNAMMAGHGGMMMKPGEAMMMMPNGETKTMPVMHEDAGMMAAAKPMDKCVIMMMGKDGKMYMTDDMKMKDGKMACEEMSMMKH